MSPSPSYFLELHALCGGEVTILSGAEQCMDCVQEKQEETRVLTQDGSSAGLLSAAVSMMIMH